MRWVVRILGGLVVLLVVAFVGGVLYLRHAVDARSAERRQAMETAFAAYGAKALEDHQWLAGVDFFQPGAGADAGPFLNPRLPWDGPERLKSKWEQSRPKDVASLQLDKAVADELRKQKSWLDAPSAVWEKLDFAWMGQLSGYGYWELQTGSPWSLGETFDWLEAPLPGFQLLITWSKLRLLKGLADGQPAAASAEVRQLAKLSFTTEILLGEMIALAILQAEDEAHARAVAKGLPVEGWTSFDAPTRKRMKRALWSLQAYTSLDTPAAHEKDFDSVKVGRCAALHEASFFALAMRPLLKQTRPADFERVGRYIEAAQECRLLWLRKEWPTPDVPERDPLGPKACQVASDLNGNGLVECRLSQLLGFVPGGRRYVGEMLLSVASPEWFKFYKEAATPPAP